MKKYICLLFLAAFLASGSLFPVLGQSGNYRDAALIRQTINGFIKSLADNNLDACMSYVSTSYYGPQGNYDHFKSFLKDRIDLHAEKYTDFVNTDFKVREMDIKGNKANTKIEYQAEWFNLESGIDQNRKFVREVSLVKAGNAWKISGWKEKEKENKQIPTKPKS